MDAKSQVKEVLKRLKKEYPGAKTALNFRTPFELLVATILSAQTTDAHVNRVTESLFKKYKNVRDYAEVPLSELQKDISSINFYRNKAKSIRSCAKVILENFKGQVPKSIEELITLPGVGRKTANIVLFNAYGINEGVGVDTHVIRLSQRLGLTKHKEPEKIEQDLMAITPKKDWGNLTNLLIFHGRRVCDAKKPKHDQCVLYDICPSRDI